MTVARRRIPVVLSEQIEYTGWVYSDLAEPRDKPDDITDDIDDAVRDLRARGDLSNSEAHLWVTHVDREVTVDLDGTVTAEDPVAPRSELITVTWHPTAQSWTVDCRPSADADWSSFDGTESELDELLALARDVATGG